MHKKISSNEKGDIFLSGDGSSQSDALSSSFEYFITLNFGKFQAPRYMIREGYFLFRNISS